MNDQMRKKFGEHHADTRKLLIQTTEHIKVRLRKEKKTERVDESQRREPIAVGKHLAAPQWLSYQD